MQGHQQKSGVWYRQKSSGTSQKPFCSILYYIQRSSQIFAVIAYESANLSKGALRLGRAETTD